MFSSITLRTLGKFLGQIPWASFLARISERVPWARSLEEITGRDHSADSAQLSFGNSNENSNETPMNSLMGRSFGISFKISIRISIRFFLENLLAVGAQGLKKLHRQIKFRSPKNDSLRNRGLSKKTLAAKFLE